MSKRKLTSVKEIESKPVKIEPMIEISEEAVTWIIEPEINIRILGQNQIFVRPTSTKSLANKISNIEESFLLFFPSEFTSKIVENTNNCGQQSRGDSFNPIDSDLLHAYFGLLIFVGIYRARNEKIHQLFDPDFGRPIFRQVMSFKTFLRINDAFRFNAVNSHQIPSRETVLNESWSFWLENLQKMQLTDTNHVSSDDVVDKFNRMLSFYSCKRQTNRLSLIILSKMIDISALNAYQIFMDINPKWNPLQRKEKRRDFMHELGLALVKIHASKRTRIVRLGKLFETQRKPEIENENDEDDSDEKVKARRCVYCSREKGSKFAYKTAVICKNCKTHICRREHSTTVCNRCYKESKR